MVTVTKHFGFEACHHLPNYKGACHNLHGHSYKLDVTVLGDIETDKSKSNYGMIIDFKELKKIVKEVAVDKYDHSNLNDFFENPTAEKMVLRIADDIQNKLPKGLFVMNVKLWETESSYAEYNRSPIQLIDGNLIFNPSMCKEVL